MKRDDDFAAYMRARWTTLVRSAILLGCSGADAEDLAQVALTRCYAVWPRVRDADNPDAYVYRVLVNAHRDSRRRRWWGERPTERVPDTAETFDPFAELDVADSVRRALAELSAAHRAVVVLRFFAHLSEYDTAQALGVPAGTVKSRTSRALAALATSAHLSTSEWSVR